MLSVRYTQRQNLKRNVLSCTRYTQRKTPKRNVRCIRYTKIPREILCYSSDTPNTKLPREILCYAPDTLNSQENNVVSHHIPNTKVSLEMVCYASDALCKKNYQEKCCAMYHIIYPIPKSQQKWSAVHQIQSAGNS